jgi:ParB/Sulfiredoxin domain
LFRSCRHRRPSPTNSERKIGGRALGRTAGKEIVVPNKIDLQIARRPIGVLRPYERNARKHPPEQIAQIAASIREWGWTMPVLIDERDLIIAGHGRVKAAKLIGIDTVLVIVARGWTEVQRRAYAIADNRLTENSEWDRTCSRSSLANCNSLALR